MSESTSQPSANNAPAVPQVYAAINAVQAALAEMGIGKDRSTNDNGKPNPKFDYKFRGIDDIYNALSPLLSHHKLLISPSYTDFVLTERKGAYDKIFHHASVTGHFDFISVVDGSKHRVTMVGEAQDGGDKSANKAMSAAYKYACLQVFCIPTVGDNDADATPHQPANYNDVYNNQQGNQTQIKDVQPIRNQAPQISSAVPLRVAPLEAFSHYNDKGKPCNADGLRMFDAEQFKALEQSIISGAYKKDVFLNGGYFYSQDQYNALMNLK